jgi:hypothetical protein
LREERVVDNHQIESNLGRRQRESKVPHWRLVFWATCGLDGGRQSTETQVVSLLGFSPPVGGGHTQVRSQRGWWWWKPVVCVSIQRDPKNIILFSFFFLPGQNNRRETAIARKHEGFSVVVVPSFSGERRFPFHHETSTTCNIEMFFFFFSWAQL